MPQTLPLPCCGKVCRELRRTSVTWLGWRASSGSGVRWTLRRWIRRAHRDEHESLSGSLVLYLTAVDARGFDVENLGGAHLGRYMTLGVEPDCQAATPCTELVLPHAVHVVFHEPEWCHRNANADQCAAVGVNQQV